MTELYIKLYRFFAHHRGLMWLSMVLLFVICGAVAAQIHLEEDINKLMPSSRNEDGSIKLAFASLRIKDKTFILFEGRNDADVELLSQVCDEFVDSLMVGETDSTGLIHDIMNSIPEEIMFDGVDYVTSHLPSFIDTGAYAGFDTLLTESSMKAQMERNMEDFGSMVGESFPQLIEMDPIGMRNVLAAQMAPLVEGTGGGFSIVNSHFFVPDSTVCVAFLTPRFSSTNTGEGSSLFQKINSLISSFEEEYPDVKICYHGSPADGYYNSSTIKADLVKTVIGSLILVVLFLMLCLRSWSTLPLLVLPVGFGALLGMAVMYLLKGQFSLLALGIGAIVLGVAMSYVLHVMVHSKYVHDPEQLLRDQVKPVSLGCITTIGSFMGLIFIKTDLLQDFGLFAAIAIVGATVFSLVYLPHLLFMEKPKINKKAFELIDRINNYPFDRNKILKTSMLLVAVVCIGFYIAKGILFDSDMRHLGYLAPNVTYSENLLKSKTAQTLRSEYFASQGSTMEEAIENFSKLSTRLDSLQKLGLIEGYTHTDALFVPLSRQEERIEAWKNYWTEERLAKVRKLINATAPAAGLSPEGFEAFFESAVADYEPGALYEEEIIPSGFQSTLMEETYDGKFLCFTQVTCAPEENGSLDNYYRVCNSIASEPDLLVLDTFYYTSGTLAQLNSDFNILQWVSMLFVFVVLLLSFNFNIRYTLLGFAPILLSWLIVLGAMAAFNMQFNLINIIISTFIFGIGVDYSIFVMNGLIGSNENAALLKYHKCAIFFSAFILIVTVGSMLFAKHPAIQSVCFATLVGMISAVVFSYVMQPAVFRWMNRNK